MPKKVRTDHLGQKFETIEQMCEYWNIPVSVFNSRIYKKWPLDKALTKPIGSKLNGEIYIDHLGNTFATLSAMARHWNIAKSTLQSRLIQKHMSVKDALTFTEKDMHNKNRNCIDHLGNTFNSKMEMCEYYNIPRQIFFGRLGLGWSLKDALTTPIECQPKNSKFIIDHKGNEFKSISDLCKYWHISRSTYNARIKLGWSIEQALTEPTKKIQTTKQPCKDHLGNKYPSLEAMCQTYNVSRHTYSTRVNKLGWTIQDALTSKNVINSIKCTDYKGNIFPTKIDLANYYALPVYFVQKNSITGDDIVDLIIKYYKHIMLHDMTIVKCIAFPYFDVKLYNHEMILHLEQILQYYHNSDSFNPIPTSKVSDKHLNIHHCIDFPYYQISLDNELMIWSYWDIIKYRHDTNFGLSIQKG